jgi:hypothetical protein
MTARKRSISTSIDADLLSLLIISSRNEGILTKYEPISDDSVSPSLAYTSSAYFFCQTYR